MTAVHALLPGHGEATLFLAKSFLSDDSMTLDTALLGVRYAASAVKRKAKGASEYWEKVAVADNPLVQAAVRQVAIE